MAPPAFVALQAEFTMLPPLQFSVCSTRLCWGRKEHGKIEKSIGLLYLDTISINFPTARRKHANPAYTILFTKKAYTSTLFVSKWLGGGLGPGASGSEWGLPVLLLRGTDSNGPKRPISIRRNYDSCELKQFYNP